MGSLISSSFIPPDELLGCTEDGCLPPEFSHDWVFGMIQVLILMMFYGYLLFYASNMLSEGSELLLLVPSLAGIVGSVVLPILGAVPDGAIMLFSGLGPGAQEQMQVGVGALAGSTIMLLTVPWGGCIFAGAMPLGKNGDAVYSKKGLVATKNKGMLAKLTGHGITPDGTIKTNSYLMVITSLCYLIIQGPAFVYARRPEGGEDVDDLNATVADTEHWWSLIGLVVSVFAFCFYIGAMVKQSQSGGGVHQKLIDDAILHQLEANPQLTLSGLIGPIVSESIKKYSSVDMPTGLQESLLAEQDKHRLKKLLAPFFYKYDVDGDGSISQTELIAFLNDLGERPTRAEAAMWMTKLDTDNTGSIEQDELVDSLLVYVKAKVEESRGGNPLTAAVEVQVAADDEDDEDEELEMPEDLEHLSPDEQQSMIKRRSFKMMGIGTLMVIVFSDPMVDVMANVGNRLTVPPFYVAFILAPLASNASEFIASFAYAGKKSKKTITVALSALEGAACMNNTFCLAIFMGLCYFKQLAWKFSAETCTTLLIEVVVAFFAMKKTQTCYDAVLILSLFPISVAMIAGLEAVGFD